MAQNDIRNSSGGSDAFRQTGGSAGFTGSATAGSGTTGSTVHTDSVRPMGETTTLPPTSREMGRPVPERGSYEPSFSEVEVTERRSRPSSAVVIGSVVAGAIAGGAIPFMLSGRKSRRSEELVVRQHEGAAAGDADIRPTSDRSSPRTPR